MRRGFISFVVCVSTFFAAFAQPADRGSREEREIEKLRESSDRGARYYPITFSPYRLFWMSLDETQLDSLEADKDRLLVQTALDLGLTPMGVMPTWILPPFANPPLVPGTPESERFGPPEALISCIPRRGTSEYRRLSEVRDKMYARLAAEYPAVRYWIVGYEPTFPFFDCDGRQLSFDNLIPHIADTLRGAKTAIQSIDHKAMIVAHFLGRASVAIEIGGRLVQPRDILEALSHEILRRGDAEDDYYDTLITKGIGGSSWIDEWTLENCFGIEEPALTGSKIAFGFGPGGASPYQGSVNVERVGTNYWIY